MSFQPGSTEEEILEGMLGEVWNQCFGGSVLPPAGHGRYDSQDRARPPEVMERESQGGCHFGPLWPCHLVGRNCAVTGDTQSSGE